VWRDVVDSLPADHWLGRESHEILAAYCRHTIRQRLLSAELAKAPADAFRTKTGFGHYDKLAGACERETRIALALARSLRLTPQSRVRPEVAGRRMADDPGGRAPWEFDQDSPSE
jgi:hypothetical protein